MAIPKMRALAPGYTAEVDTVDERKWSEILQEFDDANIYQTWPYGAVTSGRRNLSHLILRENGDIVAVAQARIAKVPLTNIGVAYVGWGPLWQRGASKTNVDTLRQAVRALRNEFVCKRRLVLRLFPVLFDDESRCLSGVLAEEGLSSSGKENRSRTILMDLSPSLENLHQGMGAMWKRNLKVAERKGLEVVEGSEDELFAAFINIYKEMVARKKFAEPNNINQFRLIQSQLPEKLKMKIMMCTSGEGVCAGVICSAIGKTAVYLFGATSPIGIKSCGSYLLQWKLVEKLKQSHVNVYNLNGINPTRNPGTYKFKADLAGANGKDVYFLGRFDAHPSVLSYSCVECGDTLRAMYRTLRQVTKTAVALKLGPKAAN